MGDVAKRDETTTEVMDMMTVVAEAARSPDVDADKMRQLLDMVHEREDRDAKRAFNRAFVAAKSEIKPIFRNQRNNQTNSNYADAFALADQIDPVLERHGLAPSFGTEPSDRDGYYRIVCDLIHEDGHEKRYSADIPVDKTGIKGSVNKTDTHAFGSSTSYGRRYLKLMMFDVATRDDDGNGAGRQPEATVTEDQIGEIRTLLIEARFEEAKVCQANGISTIDELPAAKFGPVIKGLEARRDKIRAKEKQDA